MKAGGERKPIYVEDVIEQSSQEAAREITKTTRQEIGKTPHTQGNKKDGDVESIIQMGLPPAQRGRGLLLKSLQGRH